MRHLSCLLLIALSSFSLGCLRDLDFDFEGPCSDIDCDDDNPCTDDSCVSYIDLFGTGMSGPTCVHEPGNAGGSCGSDGYTCRDGLCGDASLCDGVVCEDDNPCTEDRCAWNGICQHDPITCDDGDPCTVGSCDRRTGDCEFSEAEADGSLCWIDLDAFEAGLCEAGLCTGPCDPASKASYECPSEPSLGLSCCPNEESCFPACN